MARGPGHPVFNAQAQTARDGIGGVRDVAQKGQLATFLAVPHMDSAEALPCKSHKGSNSLLWCCVPQTIYTQNWVCVSLTLIHADAPVNSAKLLT